MGKQHGTLAKAGKVRKQTPKVAKLEKARKPRGRAYKRILYKKNFAPLVPGQKKRSPNFNAGKPEEPKKWSYYYQHILYEELLAARTLRHWLAYGKMQGILCEGGGWDCGWPGKR